MKFVQIEENAIDAFSKKNLSVNSAGSYSQIFWLALGFLVVSRLALITTFEVSPTSDMAWYYGRALEILLTGRYAEGGVITAYWPVGYPFFLAAVMAFGGTTVLVGQITNLILSALCLVLTYRFCLQRFNDARIAGTAAILLAIYPNHMGYSVGLYSEPLFTLLLLVLVNFARPDSGAGRYALMGVVAGLATLVKAQMLLLGPILLLFLGLASWSRAAISSACQRTVIGMLFMAVTIAPWTMRNLLELGAPVPVSTNGGMSLLAGNNPSMNTGLDHDFNDRDPIFQRVQFSVADQVAADKRAKDAAFGWIADNPGQFISLMPKKFFRLWIPDGESEWGFQAGYGGYEGKKVWFRSVRWLNQIFYMLLLIGATVGFSRCVLVRNPATLVAPLMVLFFTSLSMVFSGQSRYHAPLMPFVIAYAAHTYMWLWSLRKSRV